MKYINIIFLLLISNVIVAMEAECKSLASFFDLDGRVIQHKDISKAIAQQYVSDKQWWYLDKEIQFEHQCVDISWQCDQYLELTNNKNSFHNVYFNKDGTEIVGAPSHTKCFCICVWDRKSGVELERISHDDYKKAISSFSYDKELWIKNRLYCSKYICQLDDSNRGLLVQHVSHDGTGKMFAVIQSPDHFKVRICGNDVEPLYLVHDDFVRKAYFNQCGDEIITASNDCTMRLWHGKTGQELLRIMYDTCVASAWFNEMGTEIVVATDDGKIQILAKYHTDNLQQILLNKLLHTWLVLQKPSKEISSVTKLLDSVAQLLRIDWSELYRAWASFPEHVQQAMWLSMSRKIQRYGKVEK